MSSLFLKIFLSFWAAIVLFLGLAILVIRATSPPREPSVELAKALNEAVNAYHSGGEHAVGQYLEDMQVAQHVRAYVYDESGHELAVWPLQGRTKVEFSAPPGASIGLRVPDEIHVTARTICFRVFGLN